MRNHLEQVSEVIDLPTHILIKEEDEKENIVVNLRIGFHERQQKKLLETLQPIIGPPSKKGKSNFDRCTPSKSVDIVPIPMDDSHLITLWSSYLMLTSSCSTPWEIQWWFRVVPF